MGYCYNLMDSHVVSGYAKTPAGYEFVIEDSVLKFIDEYGFNVSEFLYIEERDQHQGFDEKGHANPRGVRFNVLFADKVPRREIKNISKQLRVHLSKERWLKDYVDKDYNLVVKWGIITVGVGDKNYDEDY